MGRLSDESFLPHIVGLFYATFDPVLGPTVLHQVPERLISSSTSDDREQGRHSRTSSRSPSRSASRVRARSSGPSGRKERERDSTRERERDAREQRESRDKERNLSRDRTSVMRPQTLLDFAPISEYVIPKKALHGKLVTFVTSGVWDEGFDSDSSGSESSDDENGTDTGAEYKVIGLPSVIDDGEGGRYQRNQYMWNLCFVFRASASLEAFEPVVRKTARILRSAELDSRYLSAPSPDHTPLNALLEQLFEDLNSYSETSIPLDGYNSLELSLFPFYPNPPEVQDWDVPISLVNLNELKDDNWDITAARVSKHIDGINHSARIAHLADADLALTRETLKHMLFYQVIMMVDIFQYSNMYQVTSQFPKSCQDDTVISECGAYVTHSGFPIPDWPTLATLYSRLRPGTTVHQWAEEDRLHTRGIDPRRFVTFGIIKGFLRRVHRWPIIVDRTAPLLIGSGFGPAGVGMNHYMPASTTTPSGIGSGFGSGVGVGTRRRVGFQAGERPDRPKSAVDLRATGLAGDSTFTLRSAESSASLGLGLSESPGVPSTERERDREPGRERERSDRSPRPRMVTHHTNTSLSALGRSLTSAADTHPSVSSRKTGTMRSGTNTIGLGSSARANEKRLFELEDELLGYLDGHHHTDEIQVRMGMGWAQLERVLGLDEMIGGVGKKGVAVVYR